MRASYSLALAVLSLIFWAATTSFIRHGDDFPNCFSGMWKHNQAAVGSLSHRGLSSVFLTPNQEIGETQWSERVDGHFCGFSVPPFVYAPTGMSFYLGRQGVSWAIPYAIMSVVWISSWHYHRGRRNVSLRDLLLVTAALAIALAMIQSHTALIATTFLNFATVVSVLDFGLRAALSLFNPTH